MRPSVVLRATDAGDGDGVDAVVDVVHAFFLCILLLQSPHFAEGVGRGTLDGVDPLENALEVEPRIAPDDAYVHALAVAETVGHLGHREALVLSFPVVELHFQVVVPLDCEVLFLFGRGVFALADLVADLFFQFVDALPPSEFFDARPDGLCVGEFRRQLGAFDLAVVAAVAQRLVLL